MLRANLIIALIISVFGFYFSNKPFFYGPNHPFKKYAVYFYQSPTTRQIFYLKSDQRKQQKKTSIILTPFSYLYCVEVVAQIILKYQLSWQILLQN